MLPWFVCGALGVWILALEIRWYLVKVSLKEISRDLERILSEDTNMLLTISSGSRQLRQLAGVWNRQLKVLRDKRCSYQQGDRELKTAVTNIAHDLRTPLTAISGYLELLQREEKSVTVARYLGYIENRTDAMKKLTEELFRYTVLLSADKGSLEQKDLDVKAILEESLLTYYGAMTERGISPQIRLPEEPVICRVNQDALARVFGNIFSNALKYSDGDFEAALLEDGSMEFANSARGLDEVQVGRLFDRFYTVENAHHSTGLGLSIARTLTEQMDGSIAADYVQGRLVIRLKLCRSI